MTAPAESILEARRPQPGELWSLWDMKVLLAHYFVRALKDLERLRATVASSQDHGAPTHAPLSEHTRDNTLKPLLDILNDDLSRLGLSTTGVAGARLREKLDDPTLSYAHTARFIEDIQTRLEDELSTVTVLALSAEDKKFIGTPENLFGPSISSFPSALGEEIQTAGRCLAFGLATAAVFHLMRAMESAVKAMASELGIAKVDQSWGILLSQIDDKIKLMPKGAEANEWSQARANLFHVKQAWRNETMHPKQTYTLEQAKEVFQACRAFLAHLAVLV